jgi:hypothetical protein
MGETDLCNRYLVPRRRFLFVIPTEGPLSVKSDPCHSERSNAWPKKEGSHFLRSFLASLATVRDVSIPVDMTNGGVAGVA